MTDPAYPDIPKVRAFLRDLTANNSRGWFQAEKSRYEEDLKYPALRLLDALAPEIETIAGAPVTAKLFRPNRDVRFSKDKTPYHTHLHLLWAMPSGPGWFFGISPDYVTAGVGVMGLAKDQLAQYRDAVAGPFGDDLAEALNALAPRMDPPELKRVPAPYDAGHPRAELLRRKSLAIWNDRIDGQGPLPETLTKVFTTYRPVSDWLIAALS